MGTPRGRRSGGVNSDLNHAINCPFVVEAPPPSHDSKRATMPDDERAARLLRHRAHRSRGQPEDDHRLDGAEAGVGGSHLVGGREQRHVPVQDAARWRRSRGSRSITGARSFVRISHRVSGRRLFLSMVLACCCW